MSAYLNQPFEPAPNFGDQVIHHYVKVFESGDPSDIETDVNAFLLSLEDPNLPTPFIRRIDYTSAQEANNMVSYSALIHYVTIGT